MANNGVKISFDPIKEVVIHEFVQLDMDDLLRERVTPAGTLPLLWCDGMLYSFQSMPMTRDIIKDYLMGKIHWAEVHYTKMDRYQQVMNLNDEHFGSGEMKIRVIDTTKSQLHKSFVKWLKGNI
jgi:hypothetical protein